MTDESFRILGIEKTTDEKAIKQAYREKLMHTNPEDDPEGFKELRKAYDEACRYAKNPMEEEAKPVQKDETPSGLWLERAKEIYGNIRLRQDTKAWEALFKDDTYISLEDEENCRIKMLAFMLNNFRFPTHIWKLLDKKMQIREKAGELREKFPVDFVHFIVTKCSRGEDIDFALFEGADEADYDQYLHYYDICWNSLQNKSYEEAENALKKADELNITHPALEICRVHLWEKTNRVKEAMELLEDLREKYPKDLIVQYNAADLLWRHDQKKEAALIFEKMKQENHVHYMANLRLAEWYYETGEYKRAKECADRVLRSGIDEGFMDLLKKINQAIERNLEESYEVSPDIDTALELGWCYLQDGKVNRGIRLEEEQKEVPRERLAEYKGLLTKLYMEGGDAEKVLEISVEWKTLLEEKIASGEDQEELERDKDRVRQSYFLRMHAYKILGDYQNALKEADSAVTDDLMDVSVEFEKASIYIDMGEYEKSIEICEELIADRRWNAAYATEMEACIKQNSAPGIAKAAKACISYFPEFLRPYEQLGRIYLAFKMKKEMEELLEEAEKNKVTSEKLDAYRNLIHAEETPDPARLSGLVKQFRKDYVKKLEKGYLLNFDEGLKMISELFLSYPVDFLLVERAYYYCAANRYEEAKKDFETVLVEEPHNPYILKGLGECCKYQGDYEKALIYMKKAYRYRNEDLGDAICKELYKIYSLLGDYRNALECYGKYIYEERPNKSIRHITGYANCLARCGDVEKAAWVLKKINIPSERYCETVQLYQRCGYHEEAKKALAEWSKEMKFHKIYDSMAGRYLLHQSDLKKYADYTRFCGHAAWQEILFGPQEKRSRGKIWKLLDIAAENNKNILGDQVFFAILTGNDKRGKYFSKKIKEYLNREKWKPEDHFLKRQKKKLWLQVLSLWYEDKEQIRKLLDSEEQTPVCEHCSLCICKGLNALRILFWLSEVEQNDGRQYGGRQYGGEPEKSGQNDRRNNEKMIRRLIKRTQNAQPTDEYLQAIRRWSKQSWFLIEES